MYEHKNGRPVAVKQFGLTRSGYVLDVFKEAGYLVHRISAEAGQSGSPVIKVEADGTLTIITWEALTKRYKSTRKSIQI